MRSRSQPQDLCRKKAFQLVALIRARSQRRGRLFCIIASEVGRHACAKGRGSIQSPLKIGTCLSFAKNIEKSS